jgi:hypothetical protein
MAPLQGLRHLEDWLPRIQDGTKVPGQTSGTGRSADVEGLKFARWRVPPGIFTNGIHRGSAKRPSANWPKLAATSNAACVTRVAQHYCQTSYCS